MTKAKVFNKSAEEVSELDLNPSIFGLEKINPGLVHFAVRAQNLNARKSTAHTKNRGEVQGSGKKPWKQKGTGRARAGSVRSPLWRHGGITFGPRNERDWSVKINKSSFRKAIFSALSDKARDNKLVVMEELPEISKTKELSSWLNSISSKSGLSSKLAVILPKYVRNLDFASRNLKNAKILEAGRLNVSDLIKYDLVVLKEALPVIEKTYLGQLEKVKQL